MDYAFDAAFWWGGIGPREVFSLAFSELATFYAQAERKLLELEKQNG